MLTLLQIKKEYVVGEETVLALDGVDLSFRRHEFVSVLGPSGCGKTTLLNLIGGLDCYSSGEMTIDGRSTKEFGDNDWDQYRNHSIGFVFQSYHLIPHQSVLSNVELALTLSGVSKEQRRKRALDALACVGLADQIHKKPNQMSGGQMQRVAIARALVNDPDIVLADEPTGALDSVTSVQFMEILKEISKKKLVIMVTHNPELADQYSDRIIRLLDGKVVADTKPYDPAVEEDTPAPLDVTTILPDADRQNHPPKKRKAKKSSMSFWTALSLSLNNLLTKKGRTIMVSFAGSIGIIGIALVLAVSNGIHGYIQRVQEDTLSSYPISITQETMDLASMMSTMSSTSVDTSGRDPNKVYIKPTVSQILNMVTSGYKENNLKSFKQYIDANSAIFAPHLTDIQYQYSTPLNLYRADYQNGVVKVNPSPVFQDLMEEMGMGGVQMMTSTDVFSPLIGDQSFWEKQYTVLHGKFPAAYNEVVLIVDENNCVPDYMLYTLGLLDTDELSKMLKDKNYTPNTSASYTYADLCSYSYRLVVNSDYYADKDDDGVWEDHSEDLVHLKSVLAQSETIHVVGVVRPSQGAVVSTTGVVAYQPALMTHLINRVNDSEIVKAQKQNPEIDVFTGTPFSKKTSYTWDDLQAMLQDPQVDEQTKMTLSMVIGQYQNQGLTNEEIATEISKLLTQSQSKGTYENNLAVLGVSDLSKPKSILIYPKDFNAKEAITNLIAEYNNGVEEMDKITYTDYIGLMLSSITAIVTGVSTILICFVGISLVVSSIMIGIITYISVLERTKEIGILRAMGASKRDISHVFNAETAIIGLSAGVFGILATLLLTIPINLIIRSLTDIAATAMISVWNALLLVAISVFLTMIAGLIPARMAAKKDPVIALRTE